MSGNNLQGSTIGFENCFANANNISVGPKRSIETDISKNSCFHDDKRFWPTFLRIIECDKPQETNCKGSQACLTFTFEPIRALFYDLRGC